MINDMKWEEATVEFQDRNKVGIHGKGGMLTTNKDFEVPRRNKEEGTLYKDFKYRQK